MSRKSKRIAEMVADHHGHTLDPHYLGFFDCFNKQLYYEAHEVLEHIWLKDKHGPNGAFYKGLIQLAGAFVHLQKNRPQPAAALFKLACANLERYPHTHQHLSVETACNLARKWLEDIERTQFQPDLFTPEIAPKLKLDR